MRRREFLRLSNSALLASIPLLGLACKVAPRRSNETQVQQPFRNDILGQPFTRMLTLAAPAPSGRNTQPWTIRRKDALRWTVGIEASRRLPAVDGMARETVLSLGAFLENLLLAGKHFGYVIDYRALHGSHA